MSSPSRAIGIALLASLAAGCSRGKANDEPWDVTLSSAEVRPGARSSALRAIETIAASECASEQRCEHIGMGLLYSSVTDCRVRVRAAWVRGLNKGTCPHGVSGEHLDACLTELRGEDCLDIHDDLRRPLYCRVDTLCRS